VTEIDDSPSGSISRELLGDISDCPPGSLVANFVGVAQVLLPNGAYRIVRIYPCGTVNGSTERGMLADALSDSNHERELKRRSP
jgi:hypothetical protein